MRKESSVQDELGGKTAYEVSVLIRGIGLTVVDVIGNTPDHAKRIVESVYDGCRVQGVYVLCPAEKYRERIGAMIDETEWDLDEVVDLVLKDEKEEKEV